MSKIVASRNMYINTESTPYGNGESFRLSLPPAPFSCKANQRMSLTLLNLEIRKNWYEINQTNNTFFLQLHNNTATPEIFYPVIIPPGSYRAFNSAVLANGANASNAAYNYANVDLCNAIKYGIDKALNIANAGGIITDSRMANVNNLTYTALNVFGANPSCSVLWNTVTRKFTITIPNIILAGASIDFIFAQLKTDFTRVSNFATNPFLSSNLNLYGNWSFQDSHEILGGIPNRDGDLLNVAPFFRAGMTKNNATTFSSPYVGQLNTLEGLYLRLFSSNTNNYQSPSLDRDMGNNTIITPTNIFARIPLTDAVYNDLGEMITFVDPGMGMYKTLLDATQLNSIQMSLTDDKNRPISEVSLNQAVNGVLSFKMTVRWEVEQLEFSASSAPSSIDIKSSLSPVGFVSPNDGMNSSNNIYTDYKKNHVSRFTPIYVNRNDT